MSMTSFRGKTLISVCTAFGPWCAVGNQKRKERKRRAVRGHVEEIVLIV